MNFGKISQIILFGGGRLLYEFALKLLKYNFNVLVITSERHSEEILSNQNDEFFIEKIKKEKIECIISPNPKEDNLVLSRINNETLGISHASAWIFNKEFIEKFEGRLINIHGTRLPHDRGGGGFSWRILRNERLGFCIIHLIDSGIDTGNIIKYKEFFYPPSCKIPENYQNYYIKQNSVFLDEFIEEIINQKDFNLLTQPEYLSMYWPRLSTEIHGYIDWSWSLKDLEQFICAFDDPYEGATTFWNNKKVRLKKCFSFVSDGSFHPFQKGVIYKISGGAIFIAAGEGSLIIKSVFDEKGNNMINEIKIGDRFYTPIAYLDNAKSYRAIYTPEGLKKK